MMSPDKNQFDDAKFDQVLREYGKSESRAGLEQRILAHLADKRACTINRSWPWQWIAVAVTASAVAGMAMFVEWRPLHDKLVINQLPIATTKEPGVVSIPRELNRVKPSSRRRAQPSVRPHLDQFPSPAPLNEQEELLARYVQSRHAEAVMVARARAVLEKGSLERFEQTDSE